MKSCINVADTTEKTIRNCKDSSALKHEYMGRYRETNERIFHHYQGFIKGPPLSPPLSNNLDVEDLYREKWTREIKAGTFY